MGRQFVMDASATLAWLFNEDESVGVILSEAERIVAPWLWTLEVLNAVLVKERRKLITPADGMRLLRALEDVDVEIHGEPPDRNFTTLASLARPHQLTSYDAVYLELAIHTSLPLFTRDNNLASAAERVGVAIVAE